MLTLIVIVLLSYLVGSIPTSIIVGKILRGIDIREYGSGNAGATNTFRVLGWKAGVFVIAVDIGKGIFATLVISKLNLTGVPLLASTLLQIIAGVSAVCGHIWTVFAGFRGGKGVSTAAGMIIALYPIAFLICIAIFTIVLFTTRYVSVSSMIAAVSLPIVFVVLQQIGHRPVSSPLLVLSLIMAGLIIFTHRANIRRLLNGTENRIRRLRLGRRSDK
ncbi:acyl-phosphate glycerol 3-phosphate acyltransferase [candidate division KSB1 bacterium]|nr:MAG: acyl-phosphate glycerol 3-phosphate acyltransferase [candidate division KSB1 bacterium]